jgi:hypothetical protein
MIYLEEYFATVLIYQEKNQAPVMILGRDDDVVKSAREELIKKLKIEF